MKISYIAWEWMKIKEKKAKKPTGFVGSETPAQGQF